MQPTPTYKKLLLPGLIIIGLILVGTLLFMNGGVVNQGASLFKGAANINVNTSVCKITTGPNVLLGKPAPSVQVISPNGGEVFTTGQQITVKWSSCSIPATTGMYIDIVSTNPASPVFGGKELGYSTTNDGSETMTLPAILSGSDFKVKVYPVNQQTLTVVDDSNNFFTINGGVDVGISSTVSSMMTSSANQSLGLFQFTFKVKNYGPTDIYIDDNVGLVGNYGFSIGFMNQNNVNPQYVSTSSVVTSSTAQSQGGRYVIRGYGADETFTISATLDPINAGLYRMVLGGIVVKDAAGAGLDFVKTDVNGNVETGNVSLQ